MIFADPSCIQAPCFYLLAAFLPDILLFLIRFAVKRTFHPHFGLDRENLCTIGHSNFFLEAENDSDVILFVVFWLQVIQCFSQVFLSRPCVRSVCQQWCNRQTEILFWNITKIPTRRGSI